LVAIRFAASVTQVPSAWFMLSRRALTAVFISGGWLPGGLFSRRPAMSPKVNFFAFRSRLLILMDSTHCPVRASVTRTSKLIETWTPCPISFKMSTTPGLFLPGCTSVTTPSKIYSVPPPDWGDTEKTPDFIKAPASMSRTY
jgi:hypothetical protein